MGDPFPTDGDQTYLVGVLNVTPDSFSGDGLHGIPRAASARAARMVADGAHVIDIGGESTRPGHQPVDAAEELHRVLPAIESVRAVTNAPISIDTRKAAVAERALAAGASIVNDVSGLQDPLMARVVANAGASIVLVHHGGVGEGQDTVFAVREGLELQIDAVRRAGVPDQKIIVDPGLGFGKNWYQNFEIMRRLGELRTLGRPIMVGPSRKGMIGRVLGVTPGDRMEGTAALVTICIAWGADILRVHDVREMVRVAGMTDALVRHPGRPARIVSRPPT